MPREIRKIILDDEELIQALMSYRRVREDLLPPGQILSVKPDGKNDAVIDIEFKFGPNERRDLFTLKNQKLVDALIRFCIENNIVVPRQGKRAAHHQNGFWILEMHLSGDELEHTGLARVADGASRASLKKPALAETT